MEEEVYTLEEQERDGKLWLVINGDTMYPLDRWTREDAIADYESPAAYNRRMDAFYRAYGYYD